MAESAAAIVKPIHKIGHIKTVGDGTKRMHLVECSCRWAAAAGCPNELDLAIEQHLLESED